MYSTCMFSNIECLHIIHIFQCIYMLKHMLIYIKLSMPLCPLRIYLIIIKCNIPVSYNIVLYYHMTFPIQISVVQVANPHAISRGQTFYCQPLLHYFVRTATGKTRHRSDLSPRTRSQHNLGHAKHSLRGRKCASTDDDAF